jgi:hypothetical protein
MPVLPPVVWWLMRRRKGRLAVTELRTQLPTLPQMVSETLTHLREGYDFLAGEMSHAVALIDCGEPGLAREGSTGSLACTGSRDGGALMQHLHPMTVHVLATAAAFLAVILATVI